MWLSRACAAWDSRFFYLPRCVVMQPREAARRLRGMVRCALF